MQRMDPCSYRIERWVGGETHRPVIFMVSAALPFVKLDIPKGALAMRPTRATALLMLDAL